MFMAQFLDSTIAFWIVGVILYLCFGGLYVILMRKFKFFPSKNELSCHIASLVCGLLWLALIIADFVCWMMVVITKRLFGVV